MIIRIHPDNPDNRKVQEAARILDRDGLLVVPTDTVYSFACVLGSQKGLERMCRLKHVALSKATFSIACADLSQLSAYTQPLSSNYFKMMKRVLPGPYTFILPATSQVPKWFNGKRKTIGIRVPDHPVTRSIIQTLEKPLVVTSVRDADAILEYTTDPELIEERFGAQIDGVIDGGMGTLHASTVIDCCDETPILIRQGQGDIQGGF